MLEPNTFIFDIETIPDTDSFRLLHHFPANISDKEVMLMMNAERLADTGSTFPRHHLHRIVALSLLVVKSTGGITLQSFGRNGENEQTIITRFFKGIEMLSPTLVSWNGGGFDLPVLHYRALKYGINARAYFDVGDDNKEMKWNNYLSRFHWKHIDMMDVLSGYQTRSIAPLNDIAKMCGFPGKLDTDGSQVQEMWFDGMSEEICDYCETDVLNTYGVYLRFELMRGRLTQEEYQMRITQLHEYLQGKDEPHIGEFLEAWKANPILCA